MTRFFLLFSLMVLILAAPGFAAGEAPQPMTVADNIVSTESMLGQEPIFQLNYSDVEDAIGQALAQKGAGTKVSALVNGHKDTPVYSYPRPLTVEIHGLKFDKAAHSWSANLLFVADGSVVSALPSAGRFEEVVSVPVLKREVRNTDIISEADIEMREMPLARTRADTVLDQAALIGKTPARIISARRPIRTHEIASPAIVKKNNIVQMSYRSAGMEISTNGQAVDDGAKGDVISVRNVSSHKLVRAVIDDASHVTVISSGSELSNRQQPPAANAM